MACDSVCIKCISWEIPADKSLCILPGEHCIVVFVDYLRNALNVYNCDYVQWDSLC